MELHEISHQPPQALLIHEKQPLEADDVKVASARRDTTFDSQDREIINASIRHGAFGNRDDEVGMLRPGGVEQNPNLPRKQDSAPTFLRHQIGDQATELGQLLFPFDLKDKKPLHLTPNGQERMETSCILHPVWLAVANRRDSLRVFLGRSDPDRRWVVLAIGSRSQVRIFPPEQGMQACGYFYNIANINPVVPWMNLTYFRGEFRELDPEEILRQGYRLYKSMERTLCSGGMEVAVCHVFRVRNKTHERVGLLYQSIAPCSSVADFLDALRGLGVDPNDLMIRRFEGTDVVVHVATEPAVEHHLGGWK